MKPDRTLRTTPRSCELSGDMIAGIHRWYLAAGLATETVRPAWNIPEHSGTSRASVHQPPKRKGRGR